MLVKLQVLKRAIIMKKRNRSVEEKLGFKQKEWGSKKKAKDK